MHALILWAGPPLGRSPCLVLWVPGVYPPHVCALKIPYEDALEVCPRVDAVRGEMLEPCSGAIREVEWQVLDDEEIIIRPAYPIGEVEVF